MKDILVEGLYYVILKQYAYTQPSPFTDTDDEQSKKMTSEAADVALQMSFKVRKLLVFIALVVFRTV